MRSGQSVLSLAWVARPQSHGAETTNQLGSNRAGPILINFVVVVVVVVATYNSLPRLDQPPWAPGAQPQEPQVSVVLCKNKNRERAPVTSPSLRPGACATSRMAS